MKLYDPKRNRYLIALLLAGMFLVPSFAWGLNNVATGWQIPADVTESITAHSECRNVCSNGGSYFVPTKTAAEWTAFRNNTPGDVSMGNCTLQYVLIDTDTYTGDVDSDSYGGEECVDGGENDPCTIPGEECWEEDSGNCDDDGPCSYNVYTLECQAIAVDICGT